MDFVYKNSVACQMNRKKGYVKQQRRGFSEKKFSKYKQRIILKSETKAESRIFHD